MLKTHQRIYVDKVPLDTGTFAEVTKSIINQAIAQVPGYVCVANVHMFMEALSNENLLRAMEKSFHVVPDGKPLTWLLWKFGVDGQERIPGPDLMDALCELAEEFGIPIGLLGSTSDTLTRLIAKLREKYPRLKIIYVSSPPFRAQKKREEESMVLECKASGAKLLFVGLGCPKQELWMVRNYLGFPGIMLGVGAAFDYHAGLLSRAPAFMQRFALEWLWRLFQEPRRLFKRYFRTNIGFIFKILIPAFLTKSH